MDRMDFSGPNFHFTFLRYGMAAYRTWYLLTYTSSLCSGTIFDGQSSYSIYSLFSLTVIWKATLPPKGQALGLS